MKGRCYWLLAPRRRFSLAHAEAERGPLTLSDRDGRQHTSETAADRAKSEVVVLRFLAVATAMGLLAASCAFGESDSIGTVGAASTTAATTIGTMEPPSATEGTSVATSALQPRVALERVTHGSWGEGDVWVTSVVAGGPGLVAVGAATGGRHDTNAAVWTSPDGFTWARVDDDVGTFGDESSANEESGNQVIVDVVAGSLGVVAVGADGLPGDYDAAVWLSPDGLAWQRLPQDEATLGGPGDQIMRSVVQMPGLAVAVGESAGQAAVWVSNDGKEWARAMIDGAPDGPQPSAMSDVAAGGPGLIAVGGVGFEPRPAVWLSVDGTDWSRLPSDIVGEGSGVEGGDSTVGRMTLAAAGGEGLIAVAATAEFDWPSFAAPVVWTSGDGFEWHLLESEFDGVPVATFASIGDVAWDGRRLIAVGGHESTQPGGWTPGLARLWISVDGGATWQVGSEDGVLGWSELPLPIAPGAVHLAPFDGSFVVVGNDAVPTGETINGYMQYTMSPVAWIARIDE
jgi:hypothetical protein